MGSGRTKDDGSSGDEKPGTAPDPNDETLTSPVRVDQLPAPPPRSTAGVNRGVPAARVAHVGWLLESLTLDGKQLRRMLVRPLPFRIGRLPGLDLVLPSQSVSKKHAEIYDDAGALRLRDLGSTNGTFVNRKRVTDVALVEGDVLHFADFEFRVGRQEEDGASPPEEGHATATFGHPLSHHFVAGSRELKELLADGAVSIVFQPIVKMPDGVVAAYEALGRGRHSGLPEAPGELFRIAETLGVEGALSRLFRQKTVELVRHRKDLPNVFLNTHAAELEGPGLLESLQDLRRMAPHQTLTLEIHEAALALPGVIGELRGRLAAMDIGLAYDDFGAGQARLIELAEAPPNFLKFDRRFVSGIDRAPASKQRLLVALVAAARELLVETVAEGVATAGEAEVCRRTGFTHAQGYYFGVPIPIDRI